MGPEPIEAGVPVDSKDFAEHVRQRDRLAPIFAMPLRRSVRQISMKQIDHLQNSEACSLYRRARRQMKVRLPATQKTFEGGNRLGDCTKVENFSGERIGDHIRFRLAGSPRVPRTRFAVYEGSRED